MLLIRRYYTPLPTPLEGIDVAIWRALMLYHIHTLNILANTSNFAQQLPTPRVQQRFSICRDAFLQLEETRALRAN